MKLALLYPSPNSNPIETQDSSRLGLRAEKFIDFYHYFALNP
jgi:hypothetical protein